MDNERKQEVIARLRLVASTFAPSESEPKMSMFWLVSHYNNRYENPELIGGEWIEANVPEFADLP